jgi:hypothetical protein
MSETASDRRSLRSQLTFVLLVVSTVSGLACNPPVQYDQRGGDAIAKVIRDARSDIVSDVAYLEGDLADPASVNVTLRSGTSTAEAIAFVCDVVVPAIEQGDPPESFSVTLWVGSSIIATDQSCLLPSPS